MFFGANSIDFWELLKKDVDDFLNFLSQNQMSFILFDVQKRIEYNDRALLAGIKLFEKAESWKKQQEILSSMSILIQKSLSLSKDDDKKKHKAFLSLDSLF